VFAYTVPLAVIAVVDAYVITDARDVDVAFTNPYVGEDDATMLSVPPSATDASPESPVYATLMELFWRWLLVTVPHEATPAPFMERTNWFVHAVVPAYALALPTPSVTMSDERIDETVRFVVDAFVDVIAVVDALLK